MPLDSLRQKQAASEPLIELIKPVLAAQFETDWNTLESGSAYRPEVSSRLLLAYDIDDPRVRHTDAELIAALWPDAPIIKTTALGHNKILQSPKLERGMLEFLTA